MTDAWPKAVLFDLDGTLIHTLPDIHAAANGMLGDLDLPSMTETQVRALVGKGSRNLAEQSLRQAGRDPSDADIDHALSRFLHHYDQAPIAHGHVFPGVTDVLTTLRAEGRKLAVCTNKQKVTSDTVLKGFGLYEFFDAIVGGDEVEHRKPDGRHIHHVLDMLGVSASETAMVGDSENDIGAAQDAGVRTVLVSFGICHVPLESLNADVIVDHYDQVLGAIRGLAP